MLKFPFDFFIENYSRFHINLIGAVFAIYPIHLPEKSSENFKYL